MKGKKGVTVMMDLTELLIAVICIVVGLMLLFGLGKVLEVTKQEYGIKTVSTIQAEREQLTLIRTEYVGVGKDSSATVGDMFILAQSSPDAKAALDRQEYLKMLNKNDDLPNRIILPTYDGKTFGIGGKQ
jgi:hypothetical protein